MPRYIDADALVEEIRKAQISLETNNDALWNINQKYYKGLAWAHRLTLDAPIADVREVKNGERKEIRNAYGELEGWLCECGRESKIKENYCPNCGAKMDRKGDSK